jgi:hypothetical protein
VPPTRPYHVAQSIVYVLLTAERGWSEQQVVDWLCATLPTLLLDSRD